MADVVSAVRSYLLGKTAITDIISQRLYLDRRPQATTSTAATISKLSETHSHLLGDRAGIVKTRMQIRCFAARRLDANTLAETIYKCGICAVKGTTHSVNIRGVNVEDGQRNYTVDDPEGGDAGTYVTEFDLMVTYKE